MCSLGVKANEVAVISDTYHADDIFVWHSYWNYWCAVFGVICNLCQHQTIRTLSLSRKVHTRMTMNDEQSNLINASAATVEKNVYGQTYKGK